MAGVNGGLLALAASLVVNAAVSYARPGEARSGSGTLAGAVAGEPS